MKLLLKREIFTETSTIGSLYVDGVFQCYTLEDKVREVEGQPVLMWKVMAKTAIPKGEYRVKTTYSNRFKKYLPILLNVPGFEGVRIHPGNTDKDTEGCILVGQTRYPNLITESRAAFIPLFAKINLALSKLDTVYLEIR